MSLLLPVLVLAAQAGGAANNGPDVAVELARLRAQVLSLDVALQARQARLDEIHREVEAARADVARLGEAQGDPVAAPFLSAPPTGSDSAGVAKVAVFAPRLRIDTQATHDPVDVRVRRVEARAVRTVGELQVPRDGSAVELPIDRSGALYIAEWSTGEGHTLSLQLVDGATGQTAATVQVRPNSSEGRFLFVGYRTE
jgi:hypothetical protein